MAITNVGFDGTVGETEWAGYAKRLGAPLPVVLGRTDYAVSINGAATLTVSVAAGSRMAHGVKTTSDAVASVVLDAVTTSGWTRWDAIVLHTDWTTNTVTITKVNGTAALAAPQVVPSGLVLNPGVAHDQVLALVQVTYGQSLPTAVIDRRLLASEVVTAPTLAALMAPTSGMYGMQAELLDGTRYRCLVDSSNAPTWARDFGVVVTYTDASVITPAANWVIGSPLINQCTIVNGTSVQLSLSMRRLGSSISIGTNGNFPNPSIGTLQPGLRPDVPTYAAMQYLNPGGFMLGGMVSIDPSSGAVLLESGTPGQDLAATSGGGNYSLRASISYVRQGS